MIHVRVELIVVKTYLCYGLQYTPENTGLLQDYTTGFFVNCLFDTIPIISNMSCVMDDNSEEVNGCSEGNFSYFNSSGQTGAYQVYACVPVIIHQVCFSIPIDSNLVIVEDEVLKPHHQY